MFRLRRAILPLRHPSCQAAGCISAFAPSLLKQLNLTKNISVLIEMECKCKSCPVAGLRHAPEPSQLCFEPGRVGTAVRLHTMSDSPHRQAINYIERSCLLGHSLSWYTHYLTPNRLFFPPLPISFCFSFLAKL